MKIDNFWSRVEIGKPDECWPWRGGKNAHGYGQLIMDGRRLYAHRVAYELTLGPIPDGFEVDHVKEKGCCNRTCCNPFHLEAVTPVENKLRSNWPGVTNARKTHCKRGHPFDSGNTCFGQSGHRYCRACHRIQMANARKKKAIAPRGSI